MLLNLTIRVVILVALWSVGGCGDVPRPFSYANNLKKHDEFLFAPKSFGITITQIKGPVSWIGDALAVEIASALRKRGVIASSKSTNQRSLILEASGYQQLYSGKNPDLHIKWLLKDHNGVTQRVKSLQLQPPLQFWNNPNWSMFRNVADQNAQFLIRWLALEDNLTNTHKQNSLTLMPLEGAIGDGKKSLGLAIKLALRERNINTSAKQTNPLTLFPKLSVQPKGDTLQSVTLVWVLRTKSGDEVGRITQENDIKTGELDENWGPIATEIAKGAATGIAELFIAYQRKK